MPLCGAADRVPSPVGDVSVSKVPTLTHNRPRCPSAAWAKPCVWADQGRFATVVQRRLAYPNYAKDTPHFVA